MHHDLGAGVDHDLVAAHQDHGRNGRSHAVDLAGLLACVALQDAMDRKTREHIAAGTVEVDRQRGGRIQTVDEVGDLLGAGAAEIRSGQFIIDNITVQVQLRAGVRCLHFDIAAVLDLPVPGCLHAVALSLQFLHLLHPLPDRRHLPCLPPGPFSWARSAAELPWWPCRSY